MVIVFLKELWPDVKDSNLFQAPLYWDLYAPRGLNTARIFFTCHNFEYQGTTPASELASYGIDVHQLSRHDRMQENASHDRVNLIKVINFNGSFELRKRHQGATCFTCPHSLGCDCVLQHCNNSISIFLSLPQLSLCLCPDFAQKYDNMGAEMAVLVQVIPLTTNSISNAF
ncbi:uncharacterized protein LOC131225789 [Magnolia sinica]|uniref:uncharacterized protein LOC131225789 n=1 Tax=Magnolia sinica TaxID=86752 RepID=UPI002658E463|nr:uncharacterized protein LOC131225789 [Magnolia sinica]